MIDQVTRAIHKIKDYNRLADFALRLVEDNERLRLENAQLRKENRTLRRRLHDAELRLLRRATADALLMGGLYFAGQTASKRALKAMGIGHRRWARACALLKLARVHDGRRILATEPGEFDKALNLAQMRVQREGLGAMQHRLPLWLQRG
jgi:hypothetical protein